MHTLPVLFLRSNRKDDLDLLQTGEDRWREKQSKRTRVGRSKGRVVVAIITSVNCRAFRDAERFQVGALTARVLSALV